MQRMIQIRSLVWGVEGERLLRELVTVLIVE